MNGTKPHSEKVGEAVRAAGGQVALYRALRELSCSRCCGVIREGDLFIREAALASGLPLVKLCRACEPFSRVGGLIDKLLAPDACAESRPTPVGGEAREKMLSRLAPALSRRRS